MNALNQAIAPSSLAQLWKEKRPKLQRTCFGVDRITAQQYGNHLHREFGDIKLRVSGGFKSDGLLAIAKKKPNSDKYRIICVPTIRDRMIQFALLEALRPKCMQMGIDNSVSFGVVEGGDKGVLGARRFACNVRAEKPWVYKTDIQQFFDNIGRTELSKVLKGVVKQPSLLPLLNAFIATEISDGFDPNWKQISSANGIVRGQGIRQGMPLSPLFAASYLRDFDRRLIGSNVAVARYVDDLVAFFETKAESKAFHQIIRSMLDDLGLKIGEISGPKSKTHIYAPHEPASFLGMEICRSPNGTYKLRVSQDCINDCVARISSLSDIARLQKLKVGLTDVGRFLKATVAGYDFAYAEASNRDEFREILSAEADRVRKRILLDLFGEERLATLTNRQLQFIGMT